MDDLIEALIIFKKHVGDTRWPTNCEHDVFMVLCPWGIPEADAKRLEELSFSWSSEFDCWVSYRFGSA